MSICRFTTLLAWLFLLCCMTGKAVADNTQIMIHPNDLIEPANKCLRGICIEDVNHEIYGGIYSQMIFGESFQEPAGGSAVQDFRAYGGQWAALDHVLTITGDDGPKLISDHKTVTNGTVSADIEFDNNSGENAGLIVCVSKPGMGADAFNGYEVSLDPARQLLRLARHRQDYQLLRDVPCEIPLGQWISLKVTINNADLQISVGDKKILNFADNSGKLKGGTVGLRAWRTRASFRNLQIQPSGSEVEQIAFSAMKGSGDVSSMWQPVIDGSATGRFSLDPNHPFLGTQSQVVAFDSGEGNVGMANQGLNHWGLAFNAGKPYEGYAWLKTEKPASIIAALQSGDGSKTYARQELPITAGDWQRVDFTLTPKADDRSGRFVLELNKPGTVTFGHVFLQPGNWGRFKGLPVRKDVAEGIISQSVSVIRYGGSMVNSPNYCCKNMIGPRDRRPPYDGTWYHFSSNGWGVVDFLNFCEAANIVGIPDLNVKENPQDLADFIEYLNGSSDSEWGRKRVADGHPSPYHMQYLEIGNEEKVDTVYAEKFSSAAQAIWTKDPKITLIVGDFSYHREITDPDHITGADGGIQNMDGHRQILELAKKNNQEVWFDIHIWAERLHPSDNLMAAPSYMNALDKIANGAKHRVLTFELNANSHGLMRGLANAMTINTLMRDNRMPIITSANGLQPDGQNDNGWDQGLLFLNPSRVWLESPGYVTQMQAHNDQPRLVKCEARPSTAGNVDVTASRSEDGKTLVLQVINTGAAVVADIDLGEFSQTKPTHISELSGALDAVNTAEDPTHIVPQESDWPLETGTGKLHRDFAAHSFTIIRFQ